MKTENICIYLLLDHSVYKQCTLIYPVNCIEKLNCTINIQLLTILVMYMYIDIFVMYSNKKNIGILYVRLFCKLLFLLFTLLSTMNSNIIICSCISCCYWISSGSSSIVYCWIKKLNMDCMCVCMYLNINSLLIKLYEPYLHRYISVYY